MTLDETRTFLQYRHYYSRVVVTRNLWSLYDSRVVIYDRSIIYRIDHRIDPNCWANNVPKI